MKLNIEKIELELGRIDKSYYWLAKEMGRSIQAVMYWIHNKSLSGAEPIAKVFGIDPKDLVV